MRMVDVVLSVGIASTAVWIGVVGGEVPAWWLSVTGVAGAVLAYGWGRAVDRADRAVEIARGQIDGELRAARAAEAMAKARLRQVRGQCMRHRLEREGEWRRQHALIERLQRQLLLAQGEERIGGAA